jgi:predicted ribosome quality control (RQC) complex YloA/Tae2 family protein
LDSLNKAVADTIGIHHDAVRFLEIRQNVLHKIGAQLEKNRKKLSKQTREADQAEQSETLRITGELLTIYGYQINKGTQEIALPNHYDPDGSKITIRLNPALTANENAQHYFKKYQKAKKGQLAIAEQIAKTKEVIDYLESLEAMAETATAPEDLELIIEEIEEHPTVGRPAKSGSKSGKNNKSKKPDAPAKPRQFTSPAGHLIWVGRNNLQNDRLTFKMAAPVDWWFHTQKIPGSHVILKLLPGIEIDDETINYACQLAVYFSKGRPSTKVPVDFTQRKNVKKPPASKPGFVIYDYFKTAIITPDPEILRKLGVEDVNL